MQIMRQSGTALVSQQPGESSFMKWLLLLVPVSFLLGETPGISPVFVFFVSALAIIPVAHFITEATGHIAKRTGEAVGGLLNATFGNLPELIILIVALRAGNTDLVGASIIGAILANLLLAQGASFLVGGLRFHDQEYNADSVRLYSTMMLISVACLAIPSAFARGDAESNTRLAAGVTLNISISVLLLLMYVLYLIFTLVTHRQLLAAKSGNVAESPAEDHWSTRRSMTILVAASAVAALLSEILVGSAEGAGHALGMSQVFIGLICVAVVGGAAESLSAVTMARRNRMDLSIGISLGSSIQIALFIAPLLVIVSYFAGPKPFLLIFAPQLLGFLLVAVLLSAIVAGDGRSNWYKGVQLILLYVILGVSLYLIPN